MPDEHAASRSELNLFTESLYTKLAFYEAALKMVDRKLATRFNLFDLLPPDEPSVSRVLRELLDPKGSHGQGATFLLHFLDMIGCPRPIDSNTTQVTTEHYTRHGTAKGRFIDLLIRYDGYAIGIENKLWARDQRDQVQDYLEDVKKQGVEGAWLLYITPDGRKPSQWSLGEATTVLADGSILLLAYVLREGDKPDLVTWLAECRRMCESEKIREILSDLEKHLRLRFQ